MTLANFSAPGSRLLLGGLLLAAGLLPGCGGAGGQGEPTDTATSGHVAISVDETFAPILESQVDTFQKLYTDAHVKAFYQPEDSVMLALLNDKVKLAVVTRELNEAEKAELTKQTMTPVVTHVGIDGLAIILHPSNPDSLLTVAQLRSIFSGQTTSWKQLGGKSKLGDINVVFDANRSSTLRFVRDSLLRGQELTKRVFAAKSNPEALAYVAAHPAAVGVVGVNWVSDHDDPTVTSFLKTVRVASITARPNPTKDDFIPPLPRYLAPYTPEQLKANSDLQRYPLQRNIYLINREARTGLGSGFASFVAGQKGQLIFYKSGLLPAKMQARIITTQKND
ncbi:MAG TPA: substrate-binding domain-containing protein [Hymenobacter sp.]|uniref:PstS family phosphate ABC transporter substrate-binding protein n=1 Tax=Hymenobacter sp. TaxID=1898978 RepID=UPI002D7FD88F|nr:substrate-binding domain-containing protein [Hymenobacter sp.]HET9504515.1 substrate-binding domain-containing protein [Hymenobacter sp.]